MSSSRSPALAVAAFLLIAASPAWADSEPFSKPISKPLKLPETSAQTLLVSAQLGPGPAKENSGIVRSRSHPDLFWMQNDSGDEPRIYPVRRDGTVYQSRSEAKTPGVLIGGAINVDWEDIAVDSDGHVIVADLGNNGNDRRDLVLYYVDEPSPTAERTAVKKTIFFRYPDQKSFPAPKDNFNFDSEALFTVGTTVYVLTKHRSDARTQLYRLDSPKLAETNTLVLLDSFEIGGKVTAADATEDGRKLVVTTYEGIWLFETDGKSDRYFDGRVSWLPYKANQVEAICFADDKTLLLADEAAAVLYEVPLAQLLPVRK